MDLIRRKEVMKSSAVIQRLMSAQGEKVPELHPYSVKRNRFLLRERDRPGSNVLMQPQRITSLTISSELGLKRPPSTKGNLWSPTTLQIYLYFSIFTIISKPGMERDIVINWMKSIDTLIFYRTIVTKAIKKLTSRIS